MIITLRVRSPQGVRRVQVDTNDTVNAVYSGLKESVDASDGFFLSRDPGGTQTIPPDTLLSAFSNGDFIFLHHVTATKSNTVEQSSSHEEVDGVLARRDGRMKRQLDSRVCRHGPGGMCEHCQPLEPWQVPAAAAAKHLPLHAYLRRIGRTLNGFYSQGDPDATIISNGSRCRHAENAMCSHCLPPSITLKRQPYRLVDHVEFAGSIGVEQVVGEWRRSGLQRFAWLFGTFTPRSGEEWDLGIKAVVRFVYQPPQDSGSDGVRLLPDNLETVGKAARVFGTEFVGCLYTDLHDDGTGSGRVVPRGYFVSSAELAFMVQQQEKSGRFITCIVAGSASGDIEVEAYMASSAAINYRQHDMLVPSTDPELLIVRQGEFVYSLRNEYGYEVPRRAGPGDTVPVDYFIISLTHGFNNADEQNIDGFPAPHLHPSVDQALQAIGSNAVTFNLLVMLYLKYGAFDPFNPDDINGIYGRLLEDGAGQSAGWTCPHCTYINDQADANDCAMCGLPRGSS